mgnify:CR=1 FL=1
MMLMGLIIGEKMSVGMSKTGLVAADWTKRAALGMVGAPVGWSARRLLAGASQRAVGGVQHAFDEQQRSGQRQPAIQREQGRRYEADSLEDWE